MPYAFNQPGRYDVTLTVRDDSSSASGVDSDQLSVVVNAKPVANAGSDRVVTASEVDFDGSGSHDPDGRIIAYRWDFGDGNFGEGVTPRHVYSTPGTYDATLMLTDDSGTPRNTSSENVTVVVNQRPVADADPDRSVAPQEEMFFSGLDSLDEDGEIVSYAWTFGDGNSAIGETAVHSFEAPGTYSVRLTVSDDAGLANSSASDELAVKVNAPPIPVATLREPACAGVEARFDASGSSDADGDIQTYKWLFGDGQSATGAQVAHAYERPGRYQVTLLTDDGTEVINSRRQRSMIVPVNQPPVAVAGPAQVMCPGENLFLDGGDSFDPDGTLSEARWTLVDASGSAVAKVTSLEVEHVLTDPGQYTVPLEVTDNSGSSCDTAAAFSSVRINAPPVAKGGGDRRMLLGGAHDAMLFDASESFDPDDGTLSFVWELGDGNRKVGAKVYHSYDKPGRYPVRLIVDDGSGTQCASTVDEFVVEAQSCDR